MKVQCEINYIEIENDSGYMTDGVEVTCSRCGKTEESFGTGGASVRRCLALLSEGCDENNFYVEDL